LYQNTSFWHSESVRNYLVDFNDLHQTRLTPLVRHDGVELSISAVIREAGAWACEMISGKKRPATNGTASRTALRAKKLRMFPSTVPDAF